jgi:NitT/TauT family transport system permease protein
VGLALAVFAGWWMASAAHLAPDSILPGPGSVWRAFLDEATSGRLFDNIVASLFRVGVGFGLAIALGVPAGLVLGNWPNWRRLLMPSVNFLRSLSPLAWIPFAILWFGIGDAPSIFLIFMAAVFPLVLATVAAIDGIPSVYHRVGRDYGFAGASYLFSITLPAIMPDLIAALRLTAGICWVVVVAAEMIAGRDGLGFAIWDARNGLRSDLLVAEMLVIGLIGVALDRLLLRLTRIPSVRWGYDR